MRRLRSRASNSLIASISINFRSDEAVRVTTDRSGPTGTSRCMRIDWSTENPSVACAARRCTGTGHRSGAPLSRTLVSRTIPVLVPRRMGVAYELAAYLGLHHGDGGPGAAASQ